MRILADTRYVATSRRDFPPSELSRRFGGSGIRPGPGERRFNTIAAENGIDNRVAFRNVTTDEIEDYVDDGEPVIAWGMFTGTGHVVVIVGYSEDTWICHDSAGTWNQRYEGTHYGRDGDYVEYDADAFEAALLYQGTGLAEALVPR